MTLYLETVDGFIAWTPDMLVDNTRLQPNIAELWSPEELAGWGLYEPVKPAIPAGKVVVGTTVDRVEGVVTYVHELADEPPFNPENADLTMRQLRLGLLANGYPVDFIRDTIALMAPADRAAATIWYEETKDGVSWSHPMTQGLMAVAGISQEAGAAMWQQALLL